ncbi:helix-turn-helix transcriptional regulator [Methylobacterium fujisawaense]|uniref:helix-turn-helix transcriptional regulator n=1 Tax=Methylobacterium fujisawaense TaxID=107400 RepID=UPI000DB8BC9B
MPQSLSYVIRHAREAAGLTQQALGSMLGVSRAAIGQWESGAHEPSTENLIAVCRALGVDVDSAVKGIVKPTMPAEAGPEPTIDRLSAADSFRLLGGLAKQVFENKYKYADKFIELFACHTIDNDQHTYISAQPFSPYPRPFSLRDTPDAYAVLLADNYLAPKYEENEIIYVSKIRPAKKGDYVLVRTGKHADLKRPDGGEGVDTEIVYVGRLIGFDLFGAQIMHYEPKRSLTIDISKATVVHRIYPSIELVSTMV